MIITLWMLLIVFGILSVRMIWIELVGNGLTVLGYTVLFPSVIISSVCAGIMFGGLHIPLLGV